MQCSKLTRMERRALKATKVQRQVRRVTSTAVVSYMLLSTVPTALAAKSYAYASVNLCMRASADKSAKTLVTLEKGDRVLILSNEGDWTYVQQGSVKGYVSTSYLTERKDLQPDPIPQVSKPKQTSKLDERPIIIDKDALRELAPELIGTKLEPGEKGNAVRWLQSVLTLADCYLSSVNGIYDDNTKDAVQRFQSAYSLSDDGVVGKKTFNKLFELLGVDSAQPNVEESKQVLGASDQVELQQQIPEIEATSDPQTAKEQKTEANGIRLLDWFSEGNKAFVENSPAKVYDVWTGRTYYVTRFAGINHADVVPCTPEDTQIMFETFDYKWKWNPRPVFVTVKGVTFVGSINGMPHGTSPDPSNGMDGQVCIHLNHSKTHNGNENFTNSHQKATMIAWEAAQNQ